MRVAVVLACLLLSACTSLRIEGVNAASLDAALRAEQVTTGATRAACPRLAGDYAARGEVQASRGAWAWTDPGIAGLLRTQGWDALVGKRADILRWRVWDADAKALLRLQLVSNAGEVIGAPQTLALPTPQAVSDRLQGVACVDGRLVLRAVQQWHIAGETEVRETVTLVLRRVALGLEMSVYRQRASRGGLLFAVTTHDRGSSRLLFASDDAAPAQLVPSQR